jgi:hypothetical protein
MKPAIQQPVQPPAVPHHERPPRHLRVVSTDERAPGGTSFAAIVTAIAVIAALIAGAGVYLWQRPQVTDARAQAGAARTALATTEAARDGLARQVAALTHDLRAAREVGARSVERRQALLERVGDQRTRIGVLRDRIDAQAAEIGSLDARLSATHERLAAAHGRALALGGPALGDGTYLARLEGVDATSPAHLAATVTARAGGATLATPGWRVLEVSSGTLVTLRTWKGGRTTMSFATFEHVFDGQAAWNAAMRDSTYAIRIVDGAVTSILERS